MKFGTVKFYDSRPEKRFGFIVLDREGDRTTKETEVFFHLNDYVRPDNTEVMTDRTPKKGDRVCLKLMTGRRGKPKCSPWAFESEYCAKIKLDGSKQTVFVRHIPSTVEDDLLCEDERVHTIDGDGGLDRPSYWTEIIFRPSTGEFFKIGCWDGENGGYFPQNLRSGNLPKGVTISEAYVSTPKSCRPIREESWDDGYDQDPYGYDDCYGYDGYGDGELYSGRFIN